jgi:hypothetical protein
MARGAAFTNDEDVMIRYVFNGGGNARSKYEKVQAYINEHIDLDIPPIRRYIAYVTRWRVIRDREQVQPEVVVTVRPTTNKRKICQMSEEQLNEYEKKMLERIKKRRDEIEIEKSTLPECPICMSEAENSVVASCGHVFCVQCYCSTLSRDLPHYSQRCHTCPTCRAEWNKPNKVQFMEPKSTIAICKVKGAIISV